MGVTQRLVDRVAAASSPNSFECPVCGARYQREPLNCAACGNTQFDGT
ncbi:hypothetical protein [Salarchaeum japonicum]